MQDVLDGSLARYDEIYKSEDLHFHLAYGANIEATFMPPFGTIIEYREALFGGGDPRIAALMLWHFCEEIEHRSAALMIYNHVVGNRFYRMKQLPKVLQHIKNDVAEIHAGFAKHVPGAPPCGTRGAFSRIPRWPMRRMIMAIIESQMPWHDPVRGHVPTFHGVWRNRYERGDDMTVEHVLSGQAVPA